MRYTKAQSTFEYFLLFAFLTLVIVMLSGSFRRGMKEKLLDFRDAMGNKIVNNTTVL